MASVAPAATPAWFRIVALVAIVWNAFGVVMYLSSVGMFGDPLQGLSDAERAIASGIPASITAAFAIGTFAGLAGSLGLVLGRRWAWPLLLLSLVALLILECWIVFLSRAVELHGIAVPVAVTVGALLLAWLAYHARERGWLR
jgi:hypothetical protein